MTEMSLAGLSTSVKPARSSAAVKESDESSVMVPSRGGSPLGPQSGAVGSSLTASTLKETVWVTLSAGLPSETVNSMLTSPLKSAVGVKVQPSVVLPVSSPWAVLSRVSEFSGMLRGSASAS